MQNKMQQIAFDIANELLNRNWIVKGVLSSHLQSGIEFVLRKHRIGVLCVHLQHTLYPSTALCGQYFKNEADWPQKLTSDSTLVTCKNCLKSIELGTPARRAALWAAAMKEPGDQGGRQ